MVLWREHDVSTWLFEQGFGDLIDIFSACCISGPALLRMQLGTVLDMGVEVSAVPVDDRFFCPGSQSDVHHQPLER